jgi:hypothetical protein
MTVWLKGKGKYENPNRSIERSSNRFLASPVGFAVGAERAASDLAAVERSQLG